MEARAVEESRAVFVKTKCGVIDPRLAENGSFGEWNLNGMTQDIRKTLILD